MPMWNTYEPTIDAIPHRGPSRSMGLLEGTGKFMRHIKFRPGAEPDAMAVNMLVAEAYADMRRYLAEINA